MEKKLSIFGGIWVILCMAGSLALAIVLIVLYATSDGASALSRLTEGQVAMVAAPLFLTAIGYLVLLCGKKAGFYVVLAAALFSAVCSLVMQQPLPAVFSFVNPVITWLLLKKRWDRWPEIDAQRRAVQRAEKKQKSRKVALILAALPWTGLFGVDRFYLGYVGLGLLKFLTAGGCLVLYIMDIVRIAQGKLPDRYGRPLV